MQSVLKIVHSTVRVLVLLLLTAVAARADDIRVMTSGAMSAALRELTPAFERASGSTLIIVSGGSVAGVADSIPDRLAHGERADVVIMAAAGIDELAKAGRLVAGRPAELGGPRLGIARRAGGA